MKLKYGQLLSNFAFNCNLHPYNEDFRVHLPVLLHAVVGAHQLDPSLTPA